MNEYMTNAQKAFRNKKFRMALELFQQEISDHPENPDAYFGAGRCLFVLKRLPEAIDMAEKIIGLDPSNVMAYVLKAEAYGRMKEIQKSRSEIEYAYSLEPTNPKVLYSYGFLSLHYRNWDEGISFLEKALERDPTLLYAHYYLGLVYRKKRNKGKALYYATKVNELRPSLKNRIRLIYARLDRINILIPVIICIILAFVLGIILQDFVLISILGLILLLLIYLRVIFQTP